MSLQSCGQTSRARQTQGLVMAGLEGPGSHDWLHGGGGVAVMVIAEETVMGQFPYP